MTFTDSDQLTPLEDLLNSVADSINARVQSGYDNLASVDNTTVTKTITFPNAFAGQPQVCVTVYSTTPDNFRVSKVSVSTTQVVIAIYRKAGTGSGTVNFDWIAVGP